MTEKQPLWKLQEQRDKDTVAAIFILKEWLKKQTIPFTENQHGNLINISGDQLLSRKEIVKLLLLTKGWLGIQFYQGVIGIYKLHSKITQ